MHLLMMSYFSESFRRNSEERWQYWYVWPNFLVWSPPWLYASSVKKKALIMMHLFHFAFKYLFTLSYKTSYKMRSQISDKLGLGALPMHRGVLLLVIWGIPNQLSWFLGVLEFAAWFFLWLQLSCPFDKI